MWRAILSPSRANGLNTRGFQALQEHLVFYFGCFVSTSPSRNGASDPSDFVRSSFALMLSRDGSLKSRQLLCGNLRRSCAQHTVLDTYTGLESEGQVLPRNSWTLHGLWPDFCNGSFTQYCDLNRQYDPSPSPNTTNGLSNGTPVPPYKGPNIGTFLEPFGKYDLLEYMNKYWISQGSPNYDFWGHEFSKHATSTLHLTSLATAPNIGNMRTLWTSSKPLFFTTRGSLHGIGSLVQASAPLIILRTRSRICGMLSPTTMTPSRTSDAPVRVTTAQQLGMVL